MTPLPASPKNILSGFTLVETLVAILILMLTIGALFTLASGGIFSARYARNQIIANSLMQEGLETIRNDRDTFRIQNPATPWDGWLSIYNAAGCFEEDGCVVDPYTIPTLSRYACQESGGTGGSTCPNIWFYPEDGLYAYEGDYATGSQGVYETSFNRKIFFEEVSVESLPEDFIKVTVSMSWRNGSAIRSVEESILLTDWEL